MPLESGSYFLLLYFLTPVIESRIQEIPASASATCFGTAARNEFSVACCNSEELPQVNDIPLASALYEQVPKLEMLT